MKHANSLPEVEKYPRNRAQAKRGTRRILQDVLDQDVESDVEAFPASCKRLQGTSCALQRVHMCIDRRDTKTNYLSQCPRFLARP